MSSASPIAIVEMPTFVSATRKMLDEEEREELTDFLAWNPTAGDVIAGGARVIYYYHDERIPLFLLDAYAKNDRASLSHAERNAYRQVVAAITVVLKEQKT
jgi:hypothetical protein